MAKVKYVLLLPLTYNDGSEIPKSVHDRIEEEIFLLAGGYRYGGTGKGAYRMQGGEKQIDITAEVWIVIDDEDEAALKQLVAKFAAVLGQETMYLERTGGVVDFIPPSTPGEDPK
jgi:hypothetical protein